MSPYRSLVSHRAACAGRFTLEMLEGRMLMSSTAVSFDLGPDVVIDEDSGSQVLPQWASYNLAQPQSIIIGPKVYASGLDQPQLTGLLTDNGVIITDSAGNPIPFDPYIDTGASSFVISYITSQGYTTTDIFGDTTIVDGMGLGSIHGSILGAYTDAGIGGNETGDVISPLGILLRNGSPLAAGFDPETFEIIYPPIVPEEFVDHGDYSLWVRRQDGYGEHMIVMGFDLGVQPTDVVGMPLIEQSIMVMDPTTLAIDEDELSVSRMQTTLLPKGSAVPETNLSFLLQMVDFVGGTPAPGETLPSYASNPMFQQVAISHTADDGVTRTSGDNTWLLDTGSTSSLISFAKAQEIGLIDSSYSSMDGFMADFTGLTMQIAGVGSIDSAVSVPLLELDSITIPAADGTLVTWQNVDVMVADVAGLDGVFGLNLLLPASTIDTANLVELGSNPGYFDTIIFDAHGDGTASLDLMYNPDDSTQPVETGGPAAAAGDDVEFIISPIDPTLFAAAPTIDIDGTLRFTPADNANGTTILNVVLSLDGGAVELPAQQFSITINPVNDAPVIEADSFSIDENSPAGAMVGIVSGSDVDGDGLSFSIIDGNVGNAFEIDPASGQITVAPGADLNFEALSTYSLTVSASDGQLSGSNTITINVANVNDAPIAMDQDAIAPPGYLLVLTLTGSDAETPASGLYFQLPPRTPHGQLMPFGNQFVYIPDEGFAGTDRFSYVIKDAGLYGGDSLTSAPATVNIKVYYQKQLDAKGKAEYRDSNNTLVRVSLSGGGKGTLYFAEEGPSDAAAIVLSETTDRSALSISTVGKGSGTTIHGLMVPGPIKSVKAPTTDLLGDVSIGQATSTKTTASLQFDEVADARIESLMPLSSLSMTQWTDNDDTADLLKAPWLGKLKTTGRKGTSTLAALNGDFAANLELSDASRPVTLGSVSIAGSLTADSWVIAGGAGSITVKRWATSRPGEDRMEIRAGGNMGAIKLGGCVGVDFLAGIGPAEEGTILRHAEGPGDFVSQAKVKSVSITGIKLPKGEAIPRFFADSNFSAAKIGKVSLLNVLFDTPDVDDPFGFFALDDPRAGGIASVKWRDTLNVKNSLWNGSWRASIGDVSATPGNDLEIALI